MGAGVNVLHDDYCGEKSVEIKESDVAPVQFLSLIVLFKCVS